MTPLTDQEFLLAIGVYPYDPDSFYRCVRPDVRTRVLQIVAVLQFVAIICGIIWTTV